MNWRRGLTFALLHVTIAAPLIVYEEAQQWRYLRTQSIAPVLRLAAFQETEVPWNPTVIDYWVTPQESVVRYANLPASAIAGWHYPPHSIYTVAGISDALYGRVTHRSTVATALVFILLIALQWMFVGAAPVIRPKRRWLEPAALISACAILSVVLLFTLRTQFYSIPLMIAIVTWFVWFGVAVIKLVNRAWKALTMKNAPQ